MVVAMRIALAVLASLFMAAQAYAADQTVVVKTPRGQPIADAVVMVDGQGTYKPDKALQIEQRNMQFNPFMLVVPLGGSVSFPNHDNVRHHVYSFSGAKKFELKLYGKDETRSVVFDKPGIVAVGCNIHDSMVAFIRVVTTPFADKTGANGEARLRGIPAGAITLRVWHPYAKAAGGELVRQVTLPASGGRQEIVVDLRTPVAHNHAY
jgi:plastocyanin